MTPTSRRQDYPPINIIIPVYRNLEVTRRCLESVLESDLPSAVTITVVDDDSPEPQISEYCQALAEKGLVKLQTNEKNLGFVVSANRGFAAQPDSDVLLLNSDTEVANDWLSRVRATAYRDEKIGTVTPFSNNATICSYPNFPMSGPAPAMWTTAQLDQLFSSINAGRHIEISTAVGFCMFIKRQCLNEVGGFDVESFGLGYGEECDFSLRAQALGWQNVIAADVFVFHEGAVSFSRDSAQRKEKAEILMQSLHPQYSEMVSNFIHDDPLCEIREAVDAARLAQKPLDATNLLQESAQRQLALKKHALDLNGVLLRERKDRDTQEEALGKSLEQATWLDQELRKSTEKTIWLEKQHRESLEKSIWLEKQLRESLEKSVWLQQKIDLQSERIEKKQQEIAEQNDQLFAKEQELLNRVEFAGELSAEIETLRGLLQQCREEFSRTDEALGQIQLSAAQLNEELVQMKHSRSWRYTAWLRRGIGGL